MPLTIKIKLRGMVYPTISKSGKLYRVSMGITYSGKYDRLIATVISKGYKGWT